MNIHSSLVIRLVLPGDQEKIRRIAALTAAEQNSIVNEIGDPEFISHVLISGYFHLEPKSFFVAELDHEVVGYLTGCPDSSAFVRRFLVKIFPSIAAQFFQKGIFKKKAVLSYFASSLWQSLLNYRKRARAIAGYPAHCHINMDPTHRHSGLGAQLMSKFFDHMKEKNVPGVHLATITELGKQFFLRCGFSKALTLRSPESTPEKFHELWIMVKKL